MGKSPFWSVVIDTGEKGLVLIVASLVLQVWANQAARHWKH